jgi:hypothetical protein
MAGSAAVAATFTQPWFPAKRALWPEHMQAAGRAQQSPALTLLLTPAALISCRKQCRARMTQMR